MKILKNIFAALVLGVLPFQLIADDSRDISGFWTLNAELSDDADKKFKDLVKSQKKKFALRKAEEKREKSAAGGATFKRYWEHVADQAEWNKLASAVHDGTLLSLMFATRLAIAATDIGFKAWYDDGYVRDIKPNPNGRVFTASGDEIISDGIGRTLAFWRGAKLNLETRGKKRGKIFETMSVSPDRSQLTITLEIDRKDWAKVVTLKQVFDRTGDAEKAAAAVEN